MLKESVKRLAYSLGYDIRRLPSQQEISKSLTTVDSNLGGFKEDGNFYKFRDKHKGKRCVILGNGPSLNKTDLTLLDNEITFGLNKLFLLFPKVSFRPTYMVSFVPDVVSQCIEEFEALPMPLFLSYEGRQHLKNRKAETYHFGPIRQFYFSRYPPKEICVGYTVAYVAMQLAFFMGFEQVILIGVDHSFNYNGPANKWHVIDKPTQGRHFVDNYFAPGQTWQSPNLDGAEGHYTLARVAFEHYGREIIDCTVDGKLQVFKKARLEDVLK